MAINPLGQMSQYKTEYDPSLLFAIARSQSRQALEIDSAQLPFFGVDVWTGFEISWLNSKGKPCVATAEFFIPCSSDNIVESKSFKLYLNSFNQTRLAGIDILQSMLVTDLSRVTGAEVRVELYGLDEAASPLSAITQIKGQCVDDLDVEIVDYAPNQALLSVADDMAEIEQTLYSHLLKTNCPVTGQPDWATLVVQYRGRAIDPAGLLKFVVSYREHQDFHEHCVESIYMAISATCKPSALTVYARYTRRGGLDINPLRSSTIEFDTRLPRLVRQ